MAHRSLIPTPSVLIASKAMTVGLSGASRFWRFVLIALVAKRAFSKVMQSEVKTVAFERIKPGETLILRGVRSRDLPS